MGQDESECRVKAMATQTQMPFLLTAPFKREELEEYVSRVKSWARENIADLIQRFSSDEFRAACIAYKSGILSFGGVMHRIYGDPDALLIPELGWNGSRAVLDEMVIHMELSDVREIERLRGEFPLLFVHYDPEAYGRDEQEYEEHVG